MDRDLLVHQLKRDEGTGPTRDGRLLPYWDCCGKTIGQCRCPSRGLLTIGYGRNLEANGISYAEAELLLQHDIDSTIRDLIVKLPWFEAIEPVRQAVLVNMGLNLGVHKLTAFKQTLAAVQRGDYEAAAIGMLQSAWAEQVGDRALRLAEMMRTGRWV